MKTSPTSAPGLEQVKACCDLMNSDAGNWCPEFFSVSVKIFSKKVENMISAILTEPNQEVRRTFCKELPSLTAPLQEAICKISTLSETKFKNQDVSQPVQALQRNIGLLTLFSRALQFNIDPQPLAKFQSKKL